MSSRDKKLLENLNAYDDPDNQESQQQQQQQNDDELSIFANTHFYDVDMGRPTDIAVTVDELLMQQEKQLQYPQKQPSVHPALLDHDEAQFDSQHQEHYAHLPHHYQQQQQHQHQQRQLGAGSSHDSYLATEHEIQVPPHVPSHSALFEFNEFQEFSLATELPIFDYHNGVGISPIPQARQVHAAQAVIATPPPHQYSAPVGPSQQVLDDHRSVQHPVQHSVQYPIQQHQQHQPQPQPQPQPQVRAPASYQPEPVQNFRQPPSISATSGPSIQRHSSSVSISTSVQPPVQAPTPAVSTSSSDDRNGERFVSEDEKRRRNTEASARFRFKKKLREQEMERNKRQMQTRINELETQVRQLQLENKLLKKLVNNASEQREAAELESLRNQAKEPEKKPSPKGDDDEDKESDTRDS